MRKMAPQSSLIAKAADSPSQGETPMSTLTVLVFAFTFLSGMTAGAWLTVIANRSRRSAEARR